jgi:hypothetical protein
VLHLVEITHHTPRLAVSGLVGPAVRRLLSSIITRALPHLKAAGLEVAVPDHVRPGFDSSAADADGNKAEPPLMELLGLFELTAIFAAEAYPPGCRSRHSHQL